MREHKYSQHFKFCAFVVVSLVSLRVRLTADWDHGGCAYPTSHPYSPEDALVNEAAVALLLRRVIPSSALHDAET